MLIKPIDSNTLRSLINKNEVVIIDVREPVEYAAENIPGAINIPLAIVSEGLLPPINDRKLVVHCRSGGRSSQACIKLLAENPELEIYNLEGGISAWTQTTDTIEGFGQFCLSKNTKV